jgi:hypothetical protein
MNTPAQNLMITLEEIQDSAAKNAMQARSDEAQYLASLSKNILAELEEVLAWQRAEVAKQLVIQNKN